MRTSTPGTGFLRDVPEPRSPCPERRSPRSAASHARALPAAGMDRSFSYLGCPFRPLPVYLEAIPFCLSKHYSGILGSKVFPDRPPASMDGVPQNPVSQVIVLARQFQTHPLCSAPDCLLPRKEGRASFSCDSPAPG